MSETEAAIATQRKKRGVVQGSLNQLRSWIRELESKTEHPDTPARGHRIVEKLKELGTDFKAHHFALIELIDDERDLTNEQEIFDKQDDDMANLTVSIERLLSASTSTLPSINDSGLRFISQNLQHLQKKLETLKAIVDGSLEDIDVFLLNIDEHDELITSQSSFDGAVFDTLLRLCKLIRQSHDNLSPSHDGKGVKLPKIDVPKLDGNLLKWRTFWEQFKVSIHEQDNLSEAKKLVYLHHSLSEGQCQARHRRAFLNWRMLPKCN